MIINYSDQTIIKNKNPRTKVWVWTDLRTVYPEKLLSFVNSLEKIPITSPNNK